MPDHGADKAFRVEARRGNTVECRLLVRMDGEWRERTSMAACGRVGYRRSDCALRTTDHPQTVTPGAINSHCAVSTKPLTP